VAGQLHRGPEAEAGVGARHEGGATGQVGDVGRGPSAHGRQGYSPTLPGMPWDRRTSKQQKADLARAVKAQVVHAVGPFSPYWKQRFASLGTTAAAVDRKS